MPLIEFGALVVVDTIIIVALLEAMNHIEAAWDRLRDGLYWPKRKWARRRALKRMELLKSATLVELIILMRTDTKKYRSALEHAERWNEFDQAWSSFGITVRKASTALTEFAKALAAKEPTNGDL